MCFSFPCEVQLLIMRCFYHVILWLPSGCKRNCIDYLPFSEALENHRDRISITLILKAALINSRMSYLDCISVPSSQMYTWSLSVPVTAVMLSHLALPREQRAAGCLCVELCLGDRAEGRKVGAGVGLWWSRAACASDCAGWEEALELLRGRNSHWW